MTLDRLKKMLNEGLRLQFEKEVEKYHPLWDKKVFLMVVWIVGGAFLLSIILTALIIFVKGEEVDQFFVMIASVSIGALAGILVPTPKEG